MIPLAIDGALILQLLGGAGFLLGLATLVKAFFDRPKTRADAIQVATQTATEALASLRAEMKEKDATIEKLSARIDGCEKNEDRQAQRLRETIAALWECVLWMRRALTSFTPEQRAEVGETPDVQEFFK